MDETQQLPRSTDQTRADDDPWSAPRPDGWSATPETTGAPGGGSDGPWRTGPPSSPPATSDPRRGVGLLVAVALAAGLVGGGAGAAVTYGLTDRAVVSSFQTPSTTSSASRTAVLSSVEQVASKVLPSVVSISVRGSAGQLQSSAGAGTGSGVVLSSDGLVLTNNHVVAAAANGGQIVLTFNDGKTARASIVGRDPISDLAVVKADGVSGLTPVTLGRSGDLKVGEQVVAVGSPLGLSGTVTTGIVSALNRPVRTGGAETADGDRSSVIDAIQTDAPINPGNSGGPLVNMSGELIGVNTAIATLGAGLGGQSGSIGLGFSIPVDQVRPIAEQLSTQGSATHARLGVSVGDAVGADQMADGAVLAAVEPGSAAAQAGLKQGDVITKLGDRRIDSADAVVAAVRSHRPGERVTVTYVRGGQTRTADVRLVADAPAA